MLGAARPDSPDEDLAVGRRATRSSSRRDSVLFEPPGHLRTSAARDSMTLVSPVVAAGRVAAMFGEVVLQSSPTVRPGAAIPSPRSSKG